MVFPAVSGRLGKGAMTMTPGNYLEHAAEFFHSKWMHIAERTPGGKRYFTTYEQLIPRALKAPRFLLPEEGVVLSRDVTHLQAPVRLPYPCVVLEFLWDAHATIIVAEEATPYGLPGAPDEPCIAVYGFDQYAVPEIQTRIWAPRYVMLWIHLSGHPVDQNGHVRITPFDLATEAPLSQDEYKKWGGEGQAAFSVLSLIQALQCCNVTTETIHPSEALNKKRIRNNKLPFVEYKILTLTRNRYDSASQGGHHASPRQHLRRGHIRRLADTRTVWVSQCVVGNSNKGVIVKDYQVNA